MKDATPRLQGDDAVSTELETIPCVRLRRADWYRDPSWMAWVCSPGTATWHKFSGNLHTPHEISDVFFHYANGDGSDAPVEGCGPAIPRHIWQEVCELLGDRECLVWVSNETE